MIMIRTAVINWNSVVLEFFLCYGDRLTMRKKSNLWAIFEQSLRNIWAIFNQPKESQKVASAVSSELPLIVVQVKSTYLTRWEIVQQLFDVVTEVLLEQTSCPGHAVCKRFRLFCHQSFLYCFQSLNLKDTRILFACTNYQTPNKSTYHANSTRAENCRHSFSKTWRLLNQLRLIECRCWQLYGFSTITI